MQRVAVRADGSVLVRGFGAEIGMEERNAGGNRVFEVAGLMEEMPGREDQRGGERN